MTTTLSDYRGHSNGKEEVCDPLWYPFNDHCYRLFACDLSFVQASAQCQIYGAQSHIASLHSIQENEFVFSMQGGFNDMWVGMHDPLQNHDYVWVDGSEVTFTYWREGQPDKDCGLLCTGDCAYFDVSSDFYDRWSIDDCDSGKPFVCKKPL
ncbi:rheacalcin-2-like [Glandiceps talaboti]